MLGFWSDDVKPLGPVHENIVPPTDVPIRFNELLKQTGESLVADAVIGV